MQRFVTLLALLCLSPLAANAIDGKNAYAILGPGSYSCERIVGDLTRDAKANNPASVIVYSNWLAGMLTGYNRDTKGTYSILGSMPFTDGFAWTVQYCQDHPEAIFASAAESLIAKLKPHRQTAMPKAAPPPVKHQESEDREEEDDTKSEDRSRDENHDSRYEDHNGDNRDDDDDEEEDK